MLDLFLLEETVLFGLFPEAQVYDPAAWVPKGVFLAVCRKAGAILTR